MNIKEEVNKVAKEIGIKEAYKKFLDEKIPELVDNYEWCDEDILIKVFHFDPAENSDDTFFINDEAQVDTLHTFGVARILAAGDKSRYKAGDIVKLKDYDTATIDNPQFTKWKELVAKRPVKTEVKTKEPHSTINNLLYSYQDKMFVINPIKACNDYEDYFVFKLHDGFIQNKIKNPHVYLD